MNLGKVELKHYRMSHNSILKTIIVNIICDILKEIIKSIFKD